MADVKNNFIDSLNKTKYSHKKTHYECPIEAM